jgi:methyl-accepting chemotaxis protein
MTNGKLKTKPAAFGGQTAVRVHKSVAARRPAPRRDDTAEKVMFLDLLPVPVVAMDRDHTVLYINQAAAEVAGRTPEACIGAKYWDLYDSPACRAGTCAAAQAIRTGKTCSSEGRPMVQGRQLAFKIISSPRHAEDGEIVGCFQVMVNVNEEFQIADDVARLSKAAAEGILTGRAETGSHTGRQLELANSFNSLLDAITAPLRVAIESIKAFAEGHVPDEITQDYRGEFNGLKESINALIKVVQMRNNDIELLTHAALDGRLEVRSDCRKYTGTNGKMIQNINAMLDAVVRPLHEASEVLQMSARKDLSGRVKGDYAGDYLVLKNDLNHTLETLQHAIEQIGENTSGLAASSEQLSAISQQMAGNAEETATQSTVVSSASEQVTQNVSVVATAAEEMLASIREIAKSANEAARVAKTAVSVAETTNQTIAKLGESSIEIGNVVKVITSIAQQTNLLALNATIEAARAGEAGKGFAVVANEVKELAKQTAKATEDIGQRIEAIQGDSKRSVQAIAEIGAVINQINDISHTIATAVEEQTATTNEMGRNIGEAAKGTGEITKSIAGVAAAAQSTTEGATDTQKAARSLSEMAARLQGLVGAFKI